MRTLIVYILIPCLFLLKGHYAALPAAGQHVQATPAKAAFRDLQNGGDQQLCFLDEDDKDDEDEFSSVRRKATHSTVSLLTETALFTALHTGSFKTSNRFYKNFSYPSSDKYIFHREIMI